MTNIHFIENALREIEQLKSLLEEWNSKPAILFEDQKQMAEKLSQLLSGVWAVDVIGAKSEETTKVAEELELIGKYKDDLRNALSELRDELTREAQPDDEKEQEAVEWEAMESMESPEKKESPEKEVMKEQTIIVSTTTSITAPPTSIFDTLSIHDEDEPALATPIANLAEGIGIIDRFLFIKELFSNNENEFRQAIDKLDNMKNLDEAQSYMAILFQRIDKSDHAFRQFNNLIIRRYKTSE